MRLPDKRLAEIDAAPWLVSSSATDYPVDTLIEAHSHRNKHQLIYAISGVMVGRSMLRERLSSPTISRSIMAEMCR